jgi:hypothetical protein
MDEAERQRIIGESFETLDRLADLEPREPPSVEDRLAYRKRQVQLERVERPAPEQLTEHEQARLTAGQWQAWVHEQINIGLRAAAVGISEAEVEVINELRDAIARRDRKLEKLETELTKVHAEVARLEARLIKSEVDNERRSLPLPPLRRDLN